MRRHTIQASDEEWALIKARAEAGGMNTSEFVIACGLADNSADEEELTAIEQRHMYDSIKSLVAFHNQLNNSVFEVRKFSSDNKDFETHQLDFLGLLHGIYSMLWVAQNNPKKEGQR